MNAPVRCDVFTPARIGGLVLKNRLLRAGCYEGLARGGDITDELIEHHRRQAAGGIAMTTLGYLAVSADGRGFAHELWARPELAPQLRRFSDSVHAAGAAASVQLVHCGFFSNPSVIGKRPLGASAKFCMYRGAKSVEMTPAQIEEKVADFARSARLVKDAGFDAVELHAGHGYLISQFLSPWTNTRRDEYGGSLENRLRFPAAMMRAVRMAVGPDFPVLVKLNQRDGFPGGLEIDEAVEAARAFEREGASALVPSCGFTARYSSLYMMRGNVPIREMAANGPNAAVRIATRLFGGVFARRYPFAPLFLLEGALRIRDAVRIPVVYVGGAWSLGDMEKVLATGCSFIQIGRPTIRDPEFPRRLQAGEVTESDCDQCNRCVAAMDAAGVECTSATQGLLPRDAW
jgi:2,4-dienoyl-CoA reductase-like NADH-dependent reductase (Old Yellow Enzyme family)